VDWQELEFDGVTLFTPIHRGDDRGVFLEAFTSQSFTEARGRRFPFEQMNISVSRVGTVRGIHFADVPPGQAKYVQCFDGEIFDVVVDIRLGSPTFGKWQSVVLNAVERQALYLPEGFGHGFAALSESATVGYLCSTGFSPEAEHGVHPLDPTLAITWPQTVEPITMSAKDSSAPTLADAQVAGLLPTFSACQNWISTH
jgi:dTDP-4-dehydrorhamnose 3,5-epimerase